MGWLGGRVQQPRGRIAQQFLSVLIFFNLGLFGVVYSKFEFIAFIHIVLADPQYGGWGICCGDEGFL